MKKFLISTLLAISSLFANNAFALSDGGIKFANDKEFPLCISCGIAYGLLKDTKYINKLPEIEGDPVDFFLKNYAKNNQDKYTGSGISSDEVNFIIEVFTNITLWKHLGLFKTMDDDVVDSKVYKFFSNSCLDFIKQAEQAEQIEQNP